MVNVGLLVFLSGELRGEWSGGRWGGLARPLFEPESVGEGIHLTIGDSDEDKLFNLYRGWYRGDPGGWQRGWELGAGWLDSGKDNDFGAFGMMDKVGRVALWERGGWTLKLNGTLGWQVQTIGFPGDSYHNFRLAASLDLWRGRSSSRFLRFGYFHLSNANLGGGNEGIDAFWLGTGREW